MHIPAPAHDYAHLCRYFKFVRFHGQQSMKARREPIQSQHDAGLTGNFQTLLNSGHSRPATEWLLFRGIRHSIQQMVGRGGLTRQLLVESAAGTSGRTKGLQAAEAYPWSIAFGQPNDNGHIGSLGMPQGFLGLRHDSIIGCNHYHCLQGINSGNSVTALLIWLLPHAAMQVVPHAILLAAQALAC